MKKLFAFSLFSCCILAALIGKSYEGGWEKYQGSAVPSRGEQKIIPLQYQVFSLQDSYFKNMLFALPSTPEQAQTISLPTPDGSFQRFRVWQSTMMEEGLAKKYPGFKTFTGYAENNHSVTIKMDYTYYGFHAMVMDGKNTFFIDPYSNVNDGYYISYYKKDLRRSVNNVMTCAVGEDQGVVPADVMQLTDNGLPPMKFKVNGDNLKTYRLALACTGEYAIEVAGANPTKPAVLSYMITSINRINGVYEREIAVNLVMIANTDTLIHLVAGYDAVNNPYSNSSGSTMLTQNQNVVTLRIGPTNYDIGHVFSTNSGGVATLGCVCKTTSKAQGTTGTANPVGDAFDIDYVAHEMGHQFGANHTFSTSHGSCGGNVNSQTSFEPGSGTTIMAYAGICDVDDLQPHSDDYFHGASLNEISSYINYSLGGGACPVETPTNNVPPVVAPFLKFYQIPEKTPFELIAPDAVDADHDSLTYCWEEFNRVTGGSTGVPYANIRVRGPLFRSFVPTTSTTRVFPVMDSVLKGVTSYLGEKLPDTSRFITFKLTVRDMLNGIGTFNFPTDTVHMDVTELAGPFTVTSQDAPVSYFGGSTQIVTWDVAGTDQAPVLCDSVEIYLSVDGGYTYPHMLSTGTPNDGMESLIMTNVFNTSQARIKVKGKNNIFFNVNKSNFTIVHDVAVSGVPWEHDVKIYPVPANEHLQIVNNHKSELSATISNTLGQQVWTGTVQQQLTIPVTSWSSGVYYLQLVDANGQKLVKPVVVQ